MHPTDRPVGILLGPLPGMCYRQGCVENRTINMQAHPHACRTGQLYFNLETSSSYIVRVGPEGSSDGLTITIVHGCIPWNALYGVAESTLFSTMIPPDCL